MSQEEDLKEKIKEEEENTSQREPKEEEEVVVNQKTEEKPKEEDKLKVYEDLLKRQVADFENFRKRTQEEKEKLKEFTFDSLLLDFLPIFDNVERALEVAKQKDADISIIEGLEGIVQLLDGLLKKNEIEKVDSIGKEFDPNIHEALFTKEGDFSCKTVVQEVEKAYKRKNKVIRTAKVAVGIPNNKN